MNQATSTRCSGDNKGKSSLNIRSEYANDFCHDKKSTLNQCNASVHYFGILHADKYCTVLGKAVKLKIRLL